MANTLKGVHRMGSISPYLQHEEFGRCTTCDRDNQRLDTRGASTYGGPPNGKWCRDCLTRQLTLTVSAGIIEEVGMKSFIEQVKRGAALPGLPFTLAYPAEPPADVPSHAPLPAPQEPGRPRVVTPDTAQALIEEIEHVRHKLRVGAAQPDVARELNLTTDGLRSRLRQLRKYGYVWRRN
jgi:hypothetical protein